MQPINCLPLLLVNHTKREFIRLNYSLEDTIFYKMTDPYCYNPSLFLLPYMLLLRNENRIQPYDWVGRWSGDKLTLLPIYDGIPKIFNVFNYKDVTREAILAVNQFTKQTKDPLFFSRKPKIHLLLHKQDAKLITSIAKRIVNKTIGLHKINASFSPIQLGGEWHLVLKLKSLLIEKYNFEIDYNEFEAMVMGLQRIGFISPIIVAKELKLIFTSYSI